MAKKLMQRFNIHEALIKGSFDHAVICTFTFDAPFFEEYCLEKFGSLSGTGNITVLVDNGIYERMLAAPDSARPTKANLRYLLFPVSVPGVFHPKIFLFASKNKGRLFVGSANFTRLGLTQNAEIVAVFDFEIAKNELHRPIFQQVFHYIQELSSKLESKNLCSNLQDIVREANWLVSKDKEIDGGPASLLNNLEETLWSQFIAGIEPPIENISILSRYFDHGPHFLDTLERELKPELIQIYTQNGVTNMTPQWLEHPLIRNGKAEIFLCNYLDEESPQHLHGKAIAVQKDGEITLGYGSANFTSPALLRTSNTGNMEVLIKLSGIPIRKLKPASLFDPENTAIRLMDGTILQSRMSDEEELVAERASFKIRLYEAELTTKAGEEMIEVSAKIPVDLPSSSLRCRFMFSDQSNGFSILVQGCDGLYRANITESMGRKFHDGSTIFCIESNVGGEWSTQSNSILITNLKDFKTDNPVRRERFLREAEQSPVQFFSVLRELLDSGDQQALLTFFNFCDIPVNNLPRPRFFSGARPVWEGGETMRQLGNRNLEIYIELHHAAMAFFDRHLRKLRRHVEFRSVQGIENFLHIFLAMGGILRSQGERVVYGIESKRADLSSSEWAACRNHIDVYFSKFKELLDCLWKEYLTRMVSDFSHAEVSEKFLPDLDSINGMCEDMLALRKRVEDVRLSDLGGNDLLGTRRPPGYFHCVFGEEKWAGYVSKINAELTEVEKILRVAA